MSVLIKGMEMPKTCEECDFHQYHSNGEYVCVATPLLYPMNLANYRCGRKDFCPLIEVPPHGDLIDRNALYRAFGQPPMPSMGINDDDDDFESGQFYQWKWDVETIGEQPVIIEAEGREE